MTVWLKQQGYEVNRKRVMRLMRVMGLEGQAPGPATSKPHPEHKIYPYLLRGLKIDTVNQVWSTDITYIPLKSGFIKRIPIWGTILREVIFVNCVFIGINAFVIFKKRAEILFLYSIF